MQVKIFSIPILGGEALEEEMNKFLRSHKIVDMESELSSSKRGDFWTFCIRYTTHSTSDRFLKKFDKPKVDYQKTLEEQVYKHFLLLKKIRLEIAKEEAIPAFTIFTDAELSKWKGLGKKVSCNGNFSKSFYDKTRQLTSP